MGNPQSLSNSFFNNSLQYIVSIGTLILMTPIMTETFGSKLLYVDDIQTFENQSKTMFFLCTIIGQIIFSSLSNINGGFLVLPVLEIYEITHKIQKKCIPYGIINTYSCLWIACILMASINAFLYFTKSGKYFKKLPRTINDSIMLLIGLLNIFVSYKRIDKFNNWKMALSLFILSLLITLGGISIFIKTNQPFYILLYISLIVIFFNILKYTNLNSFLLDYLISLSVKLIWSDMSQASKLNFKVIFSNIIPIFDMIFKTVLQNILSLMAYSNTFNDSFNLDNEILNTSITSFITSFSLLPSHFSCTGSIFYRISGAKSKYHSLVSGLSLIPLYFYLHHFMPFIPLFAITFVLQFIGLSILIGYLKTFIKMSNLDRFHLIIVVIAAFLFKMNIVLIITFALFISILLNFTFTGRILGTNPNIKYQDFQNPLKIVIDGNLTFLNINKTIENMSKTKSDIILDLSDCSYVDYTANCELKRFLQNFEHNIELVRNLKN